MGKSKVVKYITINIILWVQKSLKSIPMGTVITKHSTNSDINKWSPTNLNLSLTYIDEVLGLYMNFVKIFTPEISKQTQGCQIANSLQKYI
jgi:hypothetical protein